ncbi:MAG: N-6 DNA methylase [Candidatus Edwardsbacteria bacterium]|nr:N-6 DNA methylase [Candidatus Edwardsbacteria bacterium]MBU1576458.1 N-6 DNA methylase [Candidatus Edwardsbacteria bacterium]MBU2464483.1 N-6 DNA methylase [Candidatus Edwardsbacteria bacterium]MBU2594531.1 N-6 DNA methylase [Candidatus Edwardsbacteria bacterium]
MTKQEAKQQIQKLVEKYQRIAEAGKVKTYNEAQTRNEFIEPLFSFLGWDMRNLSTDNEVTTEENVSGGRVDLAFRFNNIPVMFLEAKAMKVDLDEWKWAEQAINYSWNKSVTWAVLTDFESIKVFNAEIPPKSISQNLFIELKCADFVARFDQLWLLSKESFETKLLDKEAVKWGKLTQRKQVGVKLFEDLMSWRILLTKEFKKQNDLSQEELDEGVQRVLDRLIFIRTAEDREIEQNVLMGILRSGKAGLYRQLAKEFRDFDDGFNSKLFAPHYCEEWKADDKVIAEVISGIYETRDGYRYDFSAISSDVLGGIYEQYLGYVQGRKSEEKQKSQRKAQGIYYTPKYIVDYIVKEALGEALKNAKPKDISKIKVLDPACGSGSFLTAAYDEILGKVANPNLFTKFDILKDNIYGVDLDAQAVEIAQLNLLLKVLTQKTKLPSLQHNLSSGNSLISEGDPKYKPFNFETEFKEVSAHGGFDVIIGNPPYIKEYTNRSAFDAVHDNPYYQGKMDIWTLFACRAIDLLKDGGYFSFIAPNNWLTNAGARIFRNKILTEGQITKFIDFGDFKVFKDAGIQTMIFVFQKGKPKKRYQTCYAKIVDKNIGEGAVNLLLQSNLKAGNSGITKFNATINPRQLIDKNIVFSNQTNDEILNKIEAKKNFELTEKEVAQGIVYPQDFLNKANQIKLGANFIVGEGIFGLTNKEKENLHLTKEEKSLIRPYFTTEQLGRYYSNPQNTLWLIYTDSKFKNPHEMKPYPNIKAHLDKFKGVITSDNKPYGLHRSRDEKFFVGVKIIVQRKCTNRPIFTYTDFDCYVSATFYVIKTIRLNQIYLTGLLNSSLMKYWLKNKGKMQGSNYQIDKEPLLNLPLIKPDEKAQEKIALSVDKIMKLYQDYRKTSANTDKWHALKNDIEKLDHEIDHAVYKLYGLTDEEIKAIEGQ